MAIQYITILNSFVSTEGSNGFMTNYIYYSLMAVMTDGKREVLSVKDSQMGMYLPFIRTPIDELQALEGQVKELKSTVKAMREEINELTDQKMSYVVESLYPIPDLTRLQEEDAVKKLEDAGLTPCLSRTYSADLPRSGIVYSYNRNPSLFKVVDVELIYPLPDVCGMQKEEALALLESENFTVEVVEKSSSELLNGTVMNCVHEDERTQNLVLTVSKLIPNVIGLDRNTAVQILKDAGFQVSLKREIVQEGENNRVLSCEDAADREHALILHYSAYENDVPLKGMSCADALEYLDANGIQGTVVMKYSDAPKGSIFDWAWTGLDTQDPYLTLFGSNGPQIMKTSDIQVKCQNMQGSGGDSYSATAEYDQDHKLCTIQLKYSVNPKVKHKLVSVNLADDSIRGEINSASSKGTIMEPGVSGMLSISCSLQEEPAMLSLVLNTQYGMMSKSESIRLDLTLRW